MSKYNEDYPDNQINNNKLQNAFNIIPSSSLPPTLPSEKELALETKDIVEDLKDDPDDIIYTNIDRANRMLDRIEEEVENAGSARMFEVAAQLINAITQASSSIVGTNQHADELEYKQRILDLKEREVAVKEAIGTNNSSTKTVNNMIVTDRESLLQMINDNDDKPTPKEAGGVQNTDA